MINRITIEETNEMIIENLGNIDFLALEYNQLAPIGENLWADIDNGEIIFHIKDNEVVWHIDPANLLFSMSVDQDGEYISYQHTVADILVIDSNKLEVIKPKTKFNIGDIYAPEWLVHTEEVRDDIADFVEEAYEVGAISDTFVIDLTLEEEEQEIQDMGGVIVYLNGNPAKCVVIWG